MKNAGANTEEALKAFVFIVAMCLRIAMDLLRSPNENFVPLSALGVIDPFFRRMFALDAVRNLGAKGRGLILNIAVRSVTTLIELLFGKQIQVVVMSIADM